MAELRRVDPSIRARARALRSPQSPPEARLWARLRGRQVAGLRFRRQHPIGRYIADFCCPESHLVVEIDGMLHEGTGDYDARRERWLGEQGYRVLRFTNADVLNHVGDVILRIAGECGQRPD